MAHIIRFGARKGTERNKPLFVIWKKEEKEGRELSSGPWCGRASSVPAVWRSQQSLWAEAHWRTRLRAERIYCEGLEVTHNS